MAASPLTHHEIVASLAHKTGLSQQQAKAFLQAQAEMAYENAARGYGVAGIGTLKDSDRPGREVVMQFGPEKGQTIVVPAGRRLKFWVCKAAMNVILKAGPVPSDVTQEDVFIPSAENDD